jgi:hypothetical protein
LALDGTIYFVVLSTSASPWCCGARFHTESAHTSTSCASAAPCHPPPAQQSFCGTCSSAAPACRPGLSERVLKHSTYPPPPTQTTCRTLTQRKYYYIVHIQYILQHKYVCIWKYQKLTMRAQADTSRTPAPVLPSSCGFTCSCSAQSCLVP